MADENPFDQPEMQEAPQAHDENPYSPPEMRDENPYLQFQNEEALPTSGALGAGVRGAIREFIPSTVGGAAGVGAGALAEIPGAALAPFTGGVSAFAAPLAAGIPAAIYAGGKAHALQDWVLDKLGWREGTGLASRAQETADRIDHPIASGAGEIASALPTFGTGLALNAGKLTSSIPLAGRALGAGIQGGLEAGREAYEGEDLNPTKIGMQTAAGALLAKPRGWVPGGGGATSNKADPRTGQGFEAPEEIPGNPPVQGNGFQMRGGPMDTQPQPPVRWPYQKEDPRGNPNGATPPDQMNMGDQSVDVQPPVKPLRESTASEKDIQFAAEQRDQHPTDDPMWGFWNAHVMELQNKPAQETGFVGRDDDVRWGPSIDGDYTEVTPGDLSRANDVTTVALGVSAENPRAPEVRGAGNPVGAPMTARIAARPSDPVRDYRKNKPVEQQGQAGTTSGDTHPDILRAMSDEQLDQITGPVGQAASQKKPLDFMDPVEASQLARDAEQRAHEAVAGRMQEAQKGEAFQPEAPRQPRVLPDLTQEQPAPRPVTAAVTPEQTARIHELARELGPSMPIVMERVAQLEPHEQLQALEAARGHLETWRAQEQKATYDQGARPKTETGMTARSKADAARKQSVLDAYETAAREHGTGVENEAPGATADRLTKMVKRFDELSAGNKYRPNEKPAAYQLVKAARDALRRPGKASMEAYRKAEIAMREGDKELAQTNQTEKRIEADIEKRPGVSNVVSERLLGRANEGNLGPRLPHEEFDNSLKDESAVYKQEHDGLTTYLNSISDNNWHTLNELHDGKLDSMVRTTQDPQALRRSLLDDLAETQRKNPPRLELPAEDGPVVKRTAIKTDKDLAASEVRRIDPNSAEGKAIAASKAGKLTPEEMAAYKAKKAGKKPPEIADRSEEYANAEREGAQDPAIDGSNKSLAEHWAALLADEGGAVNPQKIVRDMSDWMKTMGKAVTGYWHPKVLPEIIDYGKQIGMAGTKLNTQLTRIRQKALAGAMVARRANGDVPLPAEFDRMRMNHEDRAAQTPADKTYWDAHVKPWLDMATRDYKDLYDISERLALPGYAKMTDIVDNGPGFKQWMPRRLRKTEDEDAFNPVLNRSLSNWAASGQEREWFALQDQNGTRRVYRVNKEGKMVFYNNRKAGSAKDPPSTFNPAQVGETLPQAGGKVWTVDNATVPELETHGAGKNGKPLQFVHNPVITAIDASVGLRSALARVRLLDNIINDPKFQNLNVRTKEAAEEKWGEGNVAQTDLPQLKNHWMPKAMAWAFDDIVKQGFHYGDDGALARLAQVSQTLLKPFYMLGPEVHVFNELDKFISDFPAIAKQLPHLPQHLKDAAKSVWHQDGLQAEIMDNGGNPMYGHAAVARLMPQIGKAVGEDMSLRPWKYDPLMKAFGTNSRDVLDHMYQQTNKVMWFQSDVLYTAMYKAFKAQGLKPAEAVHETEKTIDSYVVPTTFGKTIGLGAEFGGARADAGRRLQQFATEPILSNFGRFSYGLAKSSAAMVKNLLGPNSTPTQRAVGAAQMVMTYAVMPLAYQGLSSLYGMATGNDHSEFEQRGKTRMLNTPFAIAKGEKDATAIAQRLWSPSVPVETSMRLLQNKDFAGRKIWDSPGHLAEFLAGQAVSPVRGLSAGIEQGGIGFGAQKFMEGNFGLKTPSPAGVKYQQNAGKRAIQEDRRNQLHPRGAIDRGVNWLVH